jgi:hypothetical protein
VLPEASRGVKDEPLMSGQPPSVGVPEVARDAALDVVLVDDSDDVDAVDVPAGSGDVDDVDKDSPAAWSDAPELRAQEPCQLSAHGNPVKALGLLSHLDELVCFCAARPAPTPAPIPAARTTTKMMTIIQNRLTDSPSILCLGSSLCGTAPSETSAQARW